MSKFFFIHGAGGTGAVFAAQMDAFPDSIATTLPGHGTPGAPASIAEFADAVDAELEQRGLSNVILCGSSMGGAIALELAIRCHPERSRGTGRVRAVVLIGSGAKLRVAPAVFENLERDFEAGTRWLAPMFFAQPTQLLVDEAVRLMLEVGQAQMLRDFRACNEFDATERLADLWVPLLALTGEHDVMTPPKFAQFLADRVPGAQARILPGAGHLAMVEEPVQTNEALRAFVQRIDSY